MKTPLSPTYCCFLSLSLYILKEVADNTSERFILCQPPNINPVTPQKQFCKYRSHVQSYIEIYVELTMYRSLFPYWMYRSFTGIGSARRKTLKNLFVRFSHHSYLVAASIGCQNCPKGDQKETAKKYFGIFVLWVWTCSEIMFAECWLDACGRSRREHIRVWTRLVAKHLAVLKQKYLGRPIRGDERYVLVSQIWKFWELKKLAIFFCLDHTDTRNYGMVVQESNAHKFSKWTFRLGNFFDLGSRQQPPPPYTAALTTARTPPSKEKCGRNEPPQPPLLLFFSFRWMPRNSTHPPTHLWIVIIPCHLHKVPIKMSFSSEVTNDDFKAFDCSRANGAFGVCHSWKNKSTENNWRRNDCWKTRK